MLFIAGGIAVALIAAILVIAIVPPILAAVKDTMKDEN